MQRKQKSRNKILSLVQQGKLNVALKIVKKNSKASSAEEAWLLLADMCRSAGLLNEYMKCCQSAIEVNSDCALAYSYMGNAYASQGKMQDAMTCSNKAIQMAQNNHVIQYNYAYILRQLGMYDKAVELFIKSLAANEVHGDTHSMIASCYQAMGIMDKVVFHYLKSLKHDPRNLGSLIGLGFYYQNLGEFSQALGYFDRAIGVSPDSKIALSAKANLLVVIGKKEKAYHIIRQLIDSGNVTALAIQAYSSLYTEFGDIEEAIKLGEQLSARPGLSNRDKSALFFSLGMMLDKVGRYEQAFETYTLANRAAYTGFNVQSYVDYTQRIIDIYTKEFFSACPRNTNAENKPVFIVGMPRSGTSLIEQVLSQHSKVYAGGELPYMGEIVKHLSGAKATDKIHLEYIHNFNEANIIELAREYINNIEALSSQAERVTDKMPSNYLYLGLISQMFPDAIILHCRRDPRDTCLSIFFQDFVAVQPYSSNLNDIAHVYMEYVRLMRHWTDVLNIRVCDIQYEELVGNFEQEARNILKHCELEWEDECLDFYKSKRSVATASFDQVNKPIYNQSVARWNHYERFIAEIEDILGPDL